MVFIDQKDARRLLERILTGAGVSEPRAQIMADNLVEAELRGIASHGMSRMGVYCERIASGAIRANAQVRVLSDRGSALTLDGGHAPGQVSGKIAMEMTIERAKTRGVCLTTVKNGSHFGIAAYYAKMALAEGMIGVALTNAPPVMCPWGSRDVMLGTNPFCFAFPAGECANFIFDSATSVVARGKIILADKEGRLIPEGWALDENGDPTTDAGKALKGSVMPFGGYKGSGVALIVDLLCSMLSGASSTSHVEELYGDPDTPQNLGFCFMAIDISAFTDVSEFKHRMDMICREIKASRRGKDVDEIFLPGEIEDRNAARLTAEGIPVGDNVCRELIELANTYAKGFDAKACFHPNK